MSLIVGEFVKTGIGWGRANVRPNVRPNVHSQKAYKNTLTNFESFLNQRGKTIDGSMVNQDDVDDYIAHIKAKGFKINTVAAKVAAISSYFNWSIKTKKLTAAPTIRSQPRELIAHKTVERESLEKVFNWLDSPENVNDLSKARDAAIIALMLCGLKTEQITSLNYEDIDLESSTVRTAKGALSCQKAYYRLKNYLFLKLAAGIVSLPSDPFFLNRSQTRISGRSLRRRLDGHIKSAKVSKFSTRDLHWTWEHYVKNNQNVKNKQVVKELC